MHHRLIDTKIEDSHIAFTIADSANEGTAGEFLKLRVRLDELDLPAAQKVHEMQFVNLDDCKLGEVRAAAMKRAIALLRMAIASGEAR